MAPEGVGPNPVGGEQVIHPRVEVPAFPGVIVTDANGLVLYLNDSCEVMFNRPREALMGQVLGLPVELGKNSEIDIFRPGQESGTALMNATRVQWEGQEARLCFFQDITEQKRTEVALKASEIKFRTFFENLEEGAALHELVRDATGKIVDYRILEVNPAFEVHTGITATVARGSLGTEVYGSIPPPYLDEYSKVALGGAAIAFETYFPPLAKHFRISAVSPKFGQFATLFEDITERKDNEREREAIVMLNNLDNGEIAFRELMANLCAVLQDWSGCEAVGIRLRDGHDFPYYQTRGFPKEFVEAEKYLCAHDQFGKLLLDSSGNPVLECMCGNILCQRYDPALPFFTANGSFWTNSTSALLASTTESDRQARTRNRCNGEGYESVALVPLRHGTSSLGLIQFNDHRPERFSQRLIARLERIGEVVASTLARRQAKDGLVESEAQLRSYIDHAPIGVFLCNEEGHYLHVNPAAARITGWAEQDLVGMGILDLIPPDSQAAAADQFKRLVESGYSSGELPFLRKDGSVGFWSVEAVRLSETQFLGFTSDLTARKQAEGEYATLNAFMLQAQKMESLGALAGGVAHDMNNVLGAILALASAHLASLPKDNPLHPSLETIRDAASRGGDMVKRLLDFSRKTPCEKHELSLNTLLLEEARLLERTTLAKVHVAMDLAQDLHTILGDGSALTHALMNLCINAVDAMTDGGTLTLRTRNLGHDQIEVSVEDNGSGMTKEVLDRAIDPFFTTKEVGKGTGLGLSLVFTTVTAHGGQLKIQSQPGGGTQVKMTFPATVAKAPRPELAGPVRADEVGHTLQVLLVDDDELIQKATRMLVEVLGHTVASASSGEDALDLLERGFRPEAVILDMNMPGLGGKGTLPRLRRLCPTVPVFLATGRADDDAMNLVAAHPFVTLLPKPFSFEELRGHLDQVAGVGPSGQGA
jgi:PAS domain S-box-containing protein